MIAAIDELKIEATNAKAAHTTELSNLNASHSRETQELLV